MLQAMLSGVSGIRAHQVRMGVIGNNIANVNTTGFKSGSVSFQDQLAQTLEAATSPTTDLGGTNAQQVGTGVGVGAIDTSQTPGILQNTGKTTDLAIQGSGAFVVSDGQQLHYTRDGGFTLDSNGDLVHTATGQRVVGLMAVNGIIDPGAAVTPATTIRIPMGTTLPAKASTSITLNGVLDASARNYTTYVNYAGNLSSTDTSGEANTSATVYDANGVAHVLQTKFLNPANADSSAPTGATRQWDVQVTVDGKSVYDSTAGGSKIYYVPGNGWVFPDGSGGLTSKLTATVPGSGSLQPFQVDLNMGAMTNGTGISQVSNTADGVQSSSPNWGNSVTVYDGLGNAHVISFKYRHVPLSGTPAPPTGATNEWTWSATDENGSLVGSSESAGNTPLYFDAQGKLVGAAKQSLSLSLNSNNGSPTPLALNVDVSTLQQIVSDSSVAGSQDGYPSGSLTSFSVDANGVITGSFSSGQTQKLAQVLLATFPNAAGLTRGGNNLLDVSDNSGAASIGAPSKNGRGSIASGYLEGSNVDLSLEFTNMIITERGYQANTKIITTTDTMLQDVINLIR